MKKFLKVLFYILMAIYPVIMFIFLVILKLPIRVLSLVIIALAAGYFISTTGTRRAGSEKGVIDWKPLVSSVLLLTAGLFCFFTKKNIFLKLYSVVISGTLLFIFGSTLFFKPNIIFRFATLSDKSIKGSSYESQVESYCKKVCIIWCIFFILNGSISVCTAFADKIFSVSEDMANAIWSVYNGGISYALMGMLFIVEFIVRKIVDRKMIKAYPITKFKANSRNENHIVCFEQNWKKGIYKTWKDFLIDTAKMRREFTSLNNEEVLLHCEDYWYFLVCFVALLQCKKTVYLTQNITDSFIEEILTDKMAFISDQKLAKAQYIPEFFEKYENTAILAEEYKMVPEIEAEDTKIFLYTSGSTGKPKTVPQRMKEFEEDNAFIISKWGKILNSRKLVTTVSQHHIYGFLFGISLPFTLGIPFRRTRIEYPEEFERLTDKKYTVIATPAFLKRTVEIESNLRMKSPWIFTSGGAVSPELAVLINKVFHIYPMEVYGSTETSGIAYRQQDKNGLFWTPFDNAKIWLGEDSCLRIISPYIKNPEGFATADLAEILEDGRFLLKGRSDSIVKIEEKRISMTEIETRLLESGMVKECKVIALSNEIRQYLVAALVFTKKAEETFAGWPKLKINRYFHDYLMNYFENVVIPKKWRYLDHLPCDVQGKVHKNEIKAMFDEKSE